MPAAGTTPVVKEVRWVVTPFAPLEVLGMVVGVTRLVAPLEVVGLVVGVTRLVPLVRALEDDVPGCVTGLVIPAGLEELVDEVEASH